MPSKTKAVVPRSKGGVGRTKTKAQLDAERMIRDMERAERGLPPLRTGQRSGKGKSKSLRTRVVNSIPRKHWVLRGGAHAVLGTGAVLYYVARGGGKVVGKGVAAGARHAHRRATERSWAPSGSGEHARPVRSLKPRTVTTCLPCNEHFESIQALNDHFLKTHANEKPVERRPPSSTIQRGATPRTRGKVIVHPNREKHTPRGRHRPPVPRKPRTADELVARYRTHIDRIGGRGMADGPKVILRGFASLREDLPPREKRGALDALIDIAAGLEKVGIIAPEHLADFERELNARGVDASVTRPAFLKMREAQQDFGRAAAQFIAGMLDTYAQEIKAARGPMNTPNRPFFEKAG